MYLIDENLNPNIAGALRKFAWEVESVTEVFGREGVSDDEIIDWLGKTGTVWITQDISAKRQYEFQLKTTGISAVWIKQPKLGLSGWDQFKLMVRVIDQIHEKVKSSHGAIHFWLSKRGGPSVTWEAKRY